MKKEKILLFIPGYNCEKQIVRVLDQLDDNVMKYISQIIFVNNRSTDSTEEKVLQYAKNSRLPIKVLRNDQNYNLGGSHKVAFGYAIKNGFDYVAVLHGDDQGNINDLIPVINSDDFGKYDCYLGARFMKGSKLIGYSKFRIFGNKVFNLLFSVFLRRKIYDLGSGLNMYKVDILKNEFYHKLPDRLTFNDCMILASHYYKHNLLFFPITWREEDQTSNVKMVSESWYLFKMLMKYVFNHEYIKTEFRTNIIDEYTAQEIKIENNEKKLKKEKKNSNIKRNSKESR